VKNIVIEKCRTYVARIAIEGPTMLFAAYAKVVGKLLPKHLGEMIFYRRLESKLDLVVNNSGLRFDARGKAPASRGLRLLEKEPDTIRWIDNYISKGDVLYDVGANIGVFSLYAAKKGIHVIAFEPESSNYHVLNRNIELNNFDHLITAYCVALHVENTCSILNLSSTEVGKSQHSFLRSTDDGHRELFPVLRQGAIGIAGDSLVEDYGLPYPDHIKIDVDGNEDHVIEGISRILGSGRVKTVVIELNLRSKRHEIIPARLASWGYQPIVDQQYCNPTYEATGIANRFFIRAQ